MENLSLHAKARESPGILEYYLNLSLTIELLPKKKNQQLFSKFQISPCFGVLNWMRFNYVRNLNRKQKR